MADLTECTIVKSLSANRFMISLGSVSRGSKELDQRMLFRIVELPAESRFPAWRILDRVRKPMNEQAG